MGRKSRLKATGKTFSQRLERLRATAKATRITGQVMRGKWDGFEDHVSNMSFEDLGEELALLYETKTNPTNVSLVEKIIKILETELDGRDARIITGAE